MNPPVVPPIRVSVLHRESLFALGCVEALKAQPDLRVENVPLTATHALFPRGEVVVCDVDTGLALLAQARRDPQATSTWRVLALARPGRGPSVRQLLAHGAHGCLMQDGSVEELVQAVRLVTRGQRYFSVEATLQMLEFPGHESLTARERQVLDCVARGLCNKGIARELDIALGTVKTHVKAVLGKLSASSRTQAVGIAHELGMLGPRSTSPDRTTPPPRRTPQSHALAA